MRAVRNLISVFVLAARRLWSNLGLMVGVALGLIVAVALAMSIPLYADGVNYRLLRKALAEKEQGRRRPPFAFMFRYVGAWHGAVEWSKYEKIDAYFNGPCAGTVGLPVELSVRHVKTDNFRLYPADASSYEDPKQAMDWVALGFVTDLAAHIKVIEGGLPQEQAPDSTDPVQVLVHEDKATEFGLQPGEEFVMMSSAVGPDNKPAQLRVKIAGIWRAADEEEVFWFYAPMAFDNILLVSEPTFVGRIAPLQKQPVYLGLWYLVFDGRGVHTEDVPGFLGRVSVARTTANMILENTSLDISPVDAMLQYTAAARLLTILLYVFAIPIIGLILYFIVLTANMAVQRQRNEIAVLRSRGTSSLQIIGLYTLEGLILGAVAIVLGPLLGQLVAQVMGHVRSFLFFAPSEPLVIAMSRTSLKLGFGAVLVSLLASLLPALGAARHTIVTYKQDVARSLQRPFWQRLYLDFFVLVVPLYGYYMLKQRGTISFLGRSVATAEGDPFSNPLLFLVPTLFVFALALIFVRLFPLVMELLSRIAQVQPSAAPVLALRQLARSAHQYTGPLLLIVLTLGLACFTASMAKTLDQGLVDQTYYQVGADIRLVETGESSNPGAGRSFMGMGGTSGGQEPVTGEERKPEEPVYWLFLPVSEHLKVDGVQGAARLGTFRGSVRTGQGETTVTVLGIDRLDFARVGYFRKDFARSSLGGLLNRLAVDDSAVLVPGSFLAAHGLRVGDLINVRIGLFTESFEAPMIIAGVTNLFPTVYPEDGPFLVTNLEYLFERMGGQYPYDVLLRTRPGSNTRRIVSQLEDLGLHIVNTYDARQMINDERQRPERQGILGLLSVGFIASMLLTVLGFLIYSFLSFRRRFIELGILRAIGLSVTQMGAFLGLEQFALIATGVAAGTGFGVLASKLFIPFLQVRGGPHPQTPAFVVQIAWGDIIKVYAIFGAMLLCAIAGLVWLLVHMRIAQAVKLGEAV
ncbi:MAG: ABC transporter permease [Anaerolineae bacterium]